MRMTIHAQPYSTPLNDADGAVRIIKEGAIEAARCGANPDWLQTALRGVRVLSKRQQYITSDDVWAWLRPFQLKTPDNRSMGAVMKTSQRDHYIEPTHDWQVSCRSACHGRPVRVWRSLRYETV